MARYNFRNLDPDIRKLMVAEIQQDLADGVLCKSAHFSPRGAEKYPAAIVRAAESEDEVWLADEISDCFNEVSSKGHKVRDDQSAFFSGCEFNRFYIRAVCQFALLTPGCKVRIYRARESKNPRSESEEKIGSIVDHEAILKDLRTNIATYPHFGIPEINSGLSFEIVRG